MNNNDDLNQFLPKDNPVDPDKLSIEIPAEQHPTPYDRVPSGYEPMGEIELRGRVFRGLAGGQIPWWVLISSWVIFGFIAALLLHAAIMTSTVTAWMFLAIALIPLFILGRGTVAKLSGRGRRM